LFKKLSNFCSKINNTIRIGRSNDSEYCNDIVINDENISKTHCILFYENNNWYIMDGDGENISTNGTWIISNDYSDIANNMIVRVGAIQIKTIYN